MWKSACVHPWTLKLYQIEGTVLVLNRRFVNKMNSTCKAVNCFLNSARVNDYSILTSRAWSEKTIWRRERLWLLCLKQKISRNWQGMFHDWANDRKRWSRKSDCVTLGKSSDDMLSRIRRNNSSNSQWAFCTQSAVCILYLVWILYPVCSLHFAVFEWPVFSVVL